MAFPKLIEKWESCTVPTNVQFGGSRYFSYRRSMSNWANEGCDECRRGVLTGRSDLPALVGTNIKAHARLRRCQICSAWWEENEREAHPISAAEARQTFPNLFFE